MILGPFLPAVFSTFNFILASLTLNSWEGTCGYALDGNARTMHLTTWFHWFCSHLTHRYLHAQNSSLVPSRSATCSLLCLRGYFWVSLTRSRLKHCISRCKSSTRSRPCFFLCLFTAF